MERLTRYTKLVVLDILGVLLIIAAGLIGWIPGPGGIPLLLAGLGLLAINHEWARRWLKRVKLETQKAINKLRPKNPQ
jgi:hypothetical protein